MNPLYPPALKKGDTIGVIAPSSHHDLLNLQPEVHFLEENGFNVIFHPNASMKYGQMAGKLEQRVEALHDYFKDPSVKAIFCTCGGNGALHMLDLLDYGLIRQNPKIFIGFSDITVLLQAINVQTGLVTFHGPTLTAIKKIQPHWKNQMIDILTGTVDHLPLPDKNINMQGTLYGGNLSVMQALIGTPYAPDMQDAILMLEDVNDHLSRYDRMIGHMRLAGWIKPLSGILLGDFLKSQDNGSRPFGFTIEEIVTNHTPEEISILFNAPFGHGDRLCTLPIGAPAHLKNGKLSFKSL